MNDAWDGFALEERMRRLCREGLALAFSGGVDSTLLLKIASGCPGRVLAVTFGGAWQERQDLSLAASLAKEFGVRHLTVAQELFTDPALRFNPADRCFRCKRALFGKLREIAEAENLRHCADGSNFDDLGEYRPGLAALAELGIASPLAELKITKREVRRLAEALNVPVFDRPSAPCLATRAAYGLELTEELLRRIQLGEEYLRSLGCRVVRLRVHEQNLARIEVSPADASLVTGRGAEIVVRLKSLGFDYITFDLEGFRSGSMDVALRR